MARWLRNVLLERRLDSRSNPRRNPVVRLGSPGPCRDGDFECRYEIRGFGRIRRGRTFGVDELQALQLAFVALRADLKRLGDEAAWLERPAYLGLPLVVPSFNEEVAREVETAIERIHLELERKLRKRASARRSTRTDR